MARLLEHSRSHRTATRHITSIKPFSLQPASQIYHTLCSGHANKKALVLLDAVVYTVDDGIDDSEGGNSGGPASIASPTLDIGDTGTTVKSTNSATSLSGTRNLRSTVIAVGAAVGVIALGLLTVGLLYCWRRRRRPWTCANAY